MIQGIMVEDPISNSSVEYQKHEELYRQTAQVDDRLWDFKTRPSYEADVWYNHNRNEICLEMLGDLCRGKTVLSVGARGWVEREFLKALEGALVTKTDIVPDAEDDIAFAFVENLPYLDASFDVCICREVIEHVLDSDAAFIEIKRVLRPEGLLLITTPNAYDVPIDGVRHVRSYSPHGFLTVLGEQGFDILKKRGNVPSILTQPMGLISLSSRGFTNVLAEFKEIDALTRNYEQRYYLSTQLFVLCKKGKENQ